MKKIFYSVAIIATLGTLATSCQKEAFLEEQCYVVDMEAGYSVHYSINGTSFHATLHDEDEYNAFIAYLFGLARQGNEVTFRDDNQPSTGLTKDVVVFTTSSEEEAATWSKKMASNGYTVTISFDQQSGVFTCIAIK